MSAPNFRNWGGIEHLVVDDADAIEAIVSIDRARWIATSAPADQLFAEKAVVAALDRDGDGRIRVDDVLEAREFVWSRLRDRNTVGQDALPLDALDPAHPDAGPLAVLAHRVLRARGRDGDRVTLADVAAVREAEAATFPNGDGLVTVAHADDPAVASLIEAVLATTGGAPDRSGESGAGDAELDRFLAAGREFVAWSGHAADEGLLPLGDETAAALATLEKLSPKLDQQFALSMLVAHEAAAAARAQASQAELDALDVRDPQAVRAFLDAAPLAPPGNGIALDGPLNPRFAGDLRALSAHAARVLGRTVDRLGPAEVDALRAALEPARAHRDARPAGFAAADPQAIASLIDGPAPAALRARCEADRAAAPEVERFGTLERLLALHAGLRSIVRNFVSFIDLFEATALFQMGQLVIDGRRLTFCVPVPDRAAHRKLVDGSSLFTVYAEVTRKDADAVRKLSVAAPVTAGERGGIATGKRGVFYDRDGKEWDAIVVDVAVNPISVREAMFAPITRLRSAIGERVSKLVGSKAEGFEKDAAQRTAQVPAAPAPAASASTGPAALLLGGSVAFAAVGSTLAFVAKTVSDIAPARLAAGLLGVLLLLMGASGFLGWLKLRRRDLSTLLEASGWALNGRMRLTRRLAGQFTQRPPLPPKSRIEKTDDESRIGLLVVLVVIAALAAGLWYANKHAKVAPADAVAPADPVAPAAAPSPAP